LCDWVWSEVEVRRFWVVLMVVCFVASLPMAGFAQTGKAWKFDVVSIKRSEGGTLRVGPTADGFEMRNLYMVVPIVLAYPQSQDGKLLFKRDDQQVNFPEWVSKDAFDIDAKVSAADLADWRDPAKQPEMLRAMLQAMLAERLKLQIHKEQREGNVYDLVVGKGGPKFKATDLNAAHVGQITLPDGAVVGPERSQCGVITHYWGITMPLVASFILTDAERPVVDKPGLTGRYDLQREIPNGSCSLEGSAPEALPSVFTIAGEFGLKLQPGKGTVEVLVMDHVEEPSGN